MLDIFAQATKQKLRFETNQGQLTTEQLWELPLERLNELGKSLLQKLKSFEEESFLPVEKSSKEKKEVALLNLKIDLIRAVINNKVNEEVNRKEAAERRESNRAELDALKAALAQKTADGMTSKSIASIQKRMKELASQL